MKKRLLLFSIVLVPAFCLVITSCHNNTITGSGYSTPRVYLLRMNVSGIDTLTTVNAARDTTAAIYGIYASVRDSVSLAKVQNLPLSISGKIAMDTIANTYRNAVFSSYRQVHSDTINPWGYDSLIYWKISRGDTGLAQITMRLFNSSGVQINSVSRYFTVFPAPQNK